MKLPFELDEVQQYMADKTGYFIDVPNEEKYMQHGTGWMRGDGATDAEMKMWIAWELTERTSKEILGRIGGKLDEIIGNLSKAVSAKKSVEEA